MNKLFSAILTLIILFSACIGCAQINDAGLWASLNVEKKLSSKASLTLSEEVRFNENISEIGTAFTEISADYKFSKYLSLGAGYRFIQRRRVNDFYSIRHRYMIDAALRYKIKKVGLTLRERFQTQYGDVNNSEDGKVPVHYLRSKLTVKYDLDKKYTPFLAAEVFYQLSNPDVNELDNVRYTAGFEYKFNKFSSADLFYLVNKEFYVNEPVTDYVIGVGYKYSF